MRSQVEDFLNKHNLNPQGISMDGLCQYFIREMEKGLVGHKSSLPMIPSFCSPNAKPSSKEKVIVIDAGGTNLRTCIVEFDSALQPVIRDFKSTRMPGYKREVSAQEFFDVFANEVERLIDESNRIAFCFSYAATILPNHDGIPIKFSKEIKAPQVIGMPLGENLLSNLKSRGHDISRKKIIVLNDTVATLLAALSYDTSSKYDGCIGFILGTGTNTAYIEQNSRIHKLPEGHSMKGSQIINVESGCLNICLGDIDKEFLNSTVNPLTYNFEKMISGAYLGHLGWYIISTAVKENLFSSSFASRFNELAPSPNCIETMEISSFLSIKDYSSYDENSSSGFNPISNENVGLLAKCVGLNGHNLYGHNEESSDEKRDENAIETCASDAEILRDILTAFISRAAKLTAVNLAASVLMTSFGKNPNRPVLINADGTTFYKTTYLKQFTQEYLEEYLSQKKRSAVMVKIDNSPIIGCAIGGLTL